MAHQPQKITEIWAWVCTEPDGGEGIPALSTPEGLALPMIGSDRARIESLRPYALQVAQERGYPMKLVRFLDAETIERIAPEPRQ